LRYDDKRHAQAEFPAAAVDQHAVFAVAQLGEVPNAGPADAAWAAASARWKTDALGGAEAREVART
jgi:hypothetical protein